MLAPLTALRVLTLRGMTAGCNTPLATSLLSISVWYTVNEWLPPPSHAASLRSLRLLAHYTPSLDGIECLRELRTLLIRVSGPDYGHLSSLTKLEGTSS